MLNLKLSKGAYRNVLLVGNLAFKFPTFDSYKCFMYGCYCNVSERNFCKVWGKSKRQLVAPSLFCFLFGLMQIQRRAIELTEKEFQSIDKDLMFDFETYFEDIKPSNMGWYNGKIVMIDYP